MELSGWTDGHHGVLTQEVVTLKSRLSSECPDALTLRCFYNHGTIPQEGHNLLYAATDSDDSKACDNYLQKPEFQTIELAC